MHIYIELTKAGGLISNIRFRRYISAHYLQRKNPEDKTSHPVRTKPSGKKQIKTIS